MQKPHYRFHAVAELYLAQSNDIWPVPDLIARTLCRLSQTQNPDPLALDRALNFEVN